MICPLHRHPVHHQPRAFGPRRLGFTKLPALLRRYLLRQALRPSRHRPRDRRRGSRDGRRDDQPPQVPAPDVRRQGLDPHADGRSGERADAPDDLHRDRQANPVRAAVILGVQWVFYLAFFALYLISRNRAPRSRLFRGRGRDQLHAVSRGDRRRPRRFAGPGDRQHYWVPDDATLRDVVLVVRADEAHHRDVNHGFANELAGLPQGVVAPCPQHNELQPQWKRAA